MNKSNRIAGEFSRLLRKELGPQIVGKVNARNRRQRDPNVCHSHDFCDANMVMDEAFKAVTGKHASENLNNQRIVSLWNSAWTIAKIGGFRIEQ